MNRYVNNQLVDVFVLVKQITEKESRNGSKFIDLELFDSVETIKGKMWNTSLEDLEFSEGQIIKLRARVNEWDNKPQLIIEKYRFTTEGEIDENIFIKSSPINAQNVLNEIINIVCSFKNDNLKNLTLSIIEDNKEKLLYYPAAKKIHHAEKQGLLYHVYRMLLSAIKLSEVYTNLNTDFLYCGVILHDIGKVSEIETDSSCMNIEYSKNGILLGHIVEGMRIVERKAMELNIQNSEEITLLQHILISHHGKIEYGAIKQPMFIEAQIISFLDDMDSKIYIMEEDLSKIDKGEFSPKNFFLQNQFYKL